MNPLIKRKLPGVPREPTKAYHDDLIIGLDGQVHKMSPSLMVDMTKPAPQSTERRQKAQTARVEKSERLHALVKEMHAAGKTIDEIVTATGYSVRQARKIANEGKGKTGNTEKARAARTAKAAKWRGAAREMYKNGASLQTIAEEFDVSVNMVYKVTMDLREKK